MFAVVLVGGFGTRLRPLTNDAPKPMLPVGHRPMIVSLVDRLAAGGVTDVVLALGFKPEPFEQAFVGGRHGDVQIHYAVEPEPLDTGGAIAFAARAAGIDDTFIVANGDVITDLDTAFLIAEHRRLGVDATLHLIGVDDPSAFGVVETDEHGMVQRFVEKPAPGETDSRAISAGTYVFEPAVLDLIESGRRVSVEREIFPRLVERGGIAAVETDDYWIDAGRPELYLQANLDLISGVRNISVAGLHHTAVVDGEAIVIDSLIGERATVEGTATVTGSVLLPGARVEAGARVSGSIIAGHIGAGAVVDASMIGAGYSVAAGEHLTDVKLPTPD